VVKDMNLPERQQELADDGIVHCHDGDTR
jgi:hypothetical protein